jgi:hypothetical protein
MTIKLRDYDLDAARTRFRKRVLKDRGLVFDWNDDLSIGDTELLRELEEPQQGCTPKTATWLLEVALARALEVLPIEDGGTVAKVEGGYAALPSNLTKELPLVRALMVLRGHPRHDRFRAIRLERPEQPESYPKVDIGPTLEAMYQAAPQAWSVAAFETIVFDGATTYCGDVPVEPEWTPDMIYPGSRVGEYMSILAETFLLDAVGAFDPGFTRRDALIGEWWLLQPVSPRLSHHHLAQQFGLHLAGFVPPSHVDADGRVVMVCFPTQKMSDQHRAGLIESSKFVAGWKKVLWTKDQPPLSDLSFDLAWLQGVTEDSYGPYRHSSELPPWR